MTTSPASSDNEEYLSGTAGAVSHQQQHPPRVPLAGARGVVLVRLVGVHCPLPELERRESERGDRQPGLAAIQYGEVHSHELHDLDIDSSLHTPSLHTPAECALRIRDFLLDRPRPTASERCHVGTHRAPAAAPVLLWPPMQSVSLWGRTGHRVGCGIQGRRGARCVSLLGQALATRDHQC
ncbi:hypothetical protein ABZ612_29510 [Streptomyces avermitilis]|uniref:phosphotransferase-like protein n=1 Tax=Streptomyces avermitilis TaxID=33903 RepID=UPI00340EF126